MNDSDDVVGAPLRTADSSAPVRSRSGVITVLCCDACEFMFASSDWMLILESAKAHALLFGPTHILRSKTPAFALRGEKATLVGTIEGTFSQVPARSANEQSRRTETAEESAKTK